MAIILNIETATTNCSVSLGKNGQLLHLKEQNSATYSHSEQLHVFIEELLNEAAVDLKELDAIAVSKGPGSYTGLRIGVSAAKGLCFSLDLPLIAISTLENLAHQIKIDEGHIIPVLDARRMEVYSAVFNSTHRQIRKTLAEIIEEDSFEEYVGQESVYIIGSGAAKCQELLKHSNFCFQNSSVPSALEMCGLSFQKYNLKDFEDIAYFEPSYLKDFIINKKT